ncbi:hypothetical protein [Burkholderia gladioli]|uniref:hypothetical protein n=1 Tax=Burkholderia gladioli TaxID=28095 RepID=UPI002FE089F0
MWRKRFALMDEAGAAGGSGAVAAGVDAGAAGAGGRDGATASAAGSALGAGAAGATSNFDWLPEKYRVSAQDGVLDLSASAQKLAGGYSELAKRMGDGGAPPATAAEYTVTVPDALKEKVGDLSKDELFTKFRDDMHGLGLSQKQFDGIMGRYLEMVPALVAGGQQYSTESATADLKKVWADDSSFQKNVGLAYRAGNAVASAAGMSFDDLEKAGLANNPTFIRLMASLGPEFAEDAPPGAASTAGLMTEDDVKKLMISEANTNTKHPDHKATRARIDAYYNRKYGNTPVA